MGLCKCHRKKITNLFCFSHRVNVCEFCLLSDHSQNSTYDPVCQICRQDLATNKCVRFSCLDVVHESCLDSYLQKYPASTAAAGYLCPVCNVQIAPNTNQGGPISLDLKSFLIRSSVKGKFENYFMVAYNNNESARVNKDSSFSDYQPKILNMPLMEPSYHSPSQTFSKKYARRPWFFGLRQRFRSYLLERNIKLTKRKVMLLVIIFLIGIAFMGIVKRILFRPPNLAVEPVNGN